MEPLNPQLYNALRRQFGKVVVANEGQRQVLQHSPSLHGGRIRLAPSVSGEYYRVACPICRELRDRLWINHMWGVREPETGDDRLHLAHCFNGNCLNSRPRQKQLLGLVYPLGRRAQNAVAETLRGTLQSPTSVEPAIVRMPSGLIPLCDVQHAGRARQYVAERGFDPDELWAYWHVAYCSGWSDADPPLFDRIVIPIYTLQSTFSLTTTEHTISLAGWHARAIHPLAEREPKYLTMRGMKKKQLLYNLPAAVRSQGPVVVVEGPADAWRIGANAVATFGKTMASEQHDMLIRHFRGRPIVVFYDAGADDDALRVQQALQQARADWADQSPVVCASLPPGRKDAGECTRDEAYAALGAALRS